MALYLVRRSLCVAAHSFQQRSKPLRNAELSDCAWVQLDIVCQLVCASFFFTCMIFFNHSFSLDISVFTVKQTKVWNTALTVFQQIAQGIWRIKLFLTRKQHCYSDSWPSWTFRVLQNYVSESHVVISQMGPVELINLEAGEMGQFVHYICTEFRLYWSSTGIRVWLISINQMTKLIAFHLKLHIWLEFPFYIP